MLTRKDIVVGGCYLNQYDTVFKVTHISRFWPINTSVTYLIYDLKGKLSGQSSCGIKGFLAITTKRVQIKKDQPESIYPKEFKMYEEAWIRYNQKLKKK